MNINGRVLIRETGQPVENVVVAVHDRRTHGREAPSSPVLRDAGIRLGSCATGPDGSFQISLATREDGLELVLVVFAPEDAESVTEPMAARPPERSILFISRGPRVTSGATESFIIRIPLAAAEAVLLVPRARSAEEDAIAATRGLDRIVATQEAIDRRLAILRKAARDRRAGSVKLGRTKFATLTALTPRQLEDDQRAESREDAEAVLERTATDTIARLATTPISFPIPASPEMREAMGLRVEGNRLVGTVSFSSIESAMLASGQDLVRSRTIVDLGSEPPPLEAMTTTTGGSQPAATGDFKLAIQDAVFNQIGDLVGYPVFDHPTVGTIENDLEKLKSIPGPVETKATHDFHTLQIAWRHVWIQLFDKKLRQSAAELYAEAVGENDDEPDPDEPALDPMVVKDIQQTRDFVSSVRSWQRARSPAGVAHVGSKEAAQQQMLEAAKQANQNTSQASPVQPTQKSDPITSSADARTRLERLLLELAEMLAEPYAFNVFAEDTYNFGLALTYRQEWEFSGYQVGDLVSTLPLAPNESRRYTKKHVVTRSRAEGSKATSLTSGSETRSQVMRADAEVMRKVSTATDFKLAAEGKFTIGIGSFGASSEFRASNKFDSSSTKREFQEATLKAAREYRDERAIDVSTKAEDNYETTTSGEITNPNNELTVTYLFYELERKYEIFTHLYRVRPIVLVAQAVPEPSEINEAWLVAHQWILARALLDESFRPALDYLSSGFAGDELSVQVLEASWSSQRDAVAHYEGQVQHNIDVRDQLRELLVASSLDLAKAKSLGNKVVGAFMFFGAAEAATGLGSLSQEKREELEANRKAAETRLAYVEQALEIAKGAYDKAFAAFTTATAELSKAKQQQFSRRVAIDQLRVHVKQNIIYYMQAIWSHEPPDQRYFRLYSKKIKITLGPDDPVPVDVEIPPYKFAGMLASDDKKPPKLNLVGPPQIKTAVVDLVELADIDNPLGFKGNYIILPLKRTTWLTTLMMADYLDSYFGVTDPDPLGNHPPKQIVALVDSILASESATNPIHPDERSALEEIRDEAWSHVTSGADTVVLPSGQLFIEALPGSHTLLEGFKLQHRIEDVRKAQAEVRKHELENLRLAARLVVSEQYENPIAEKQIVLGTDPTITFGNG